MSTVAFQQVSKRYAGLAAVRDFSLDIASGELVTLLGPSGCGKTTTLNLVAGFMPPDAGNILIDGQSVERLPAHRRNTAMVFQGYALFPHLSVARNVAFGLEVRKLPRAEIAERVARALDLVRLAHLGERLPRQLSGGQQQRVAIARALAINPAVLLLDEPLSNLDAKLREDMRSEIRAMQRAVGITAIYVTHDQEEALAISDRIVVMNGGLVEQVGTPQSVYHAPSTAFVASFIGAANLVTATAQCCADGRVRAVTEDGLVFSAQTPHDVAAGTRGALAIRPEHICLNAADASDNCFEASIEDGSFLGPVSILTVRVKSHVLRVRTNSFEVPPEGLVRVVFPFERCLFIPGSA